MKDKTNAVSHNDISNADREFYIGGSWLTAIGVAIAAVFGA